MKTKKLKINNIPAIIWGDKSNMQEQSLIQDFSNEFSCNLSILENGEHYFLCTWNCMDFIEIKRR